MKQWLGDEYEAPPTSEQARGEDKKIERAEGERGQNKDSAKSGRVVVVHCKAGKGRSGTMACSYLMAECGWTAQQALDRFTERRMRPKFGNGVTIPSQLRWITYVDRWVKAGKPEYVDRPVEILEIHFRGLRHGVKLAVEGYVDEGKQIHVFHTFKNSERFVVEGDAPGGGGLVDLVSDMTSAWGAREDKEDDKNKDNSETSSRSNSTPDTPDLQAGKIRRPKTDFQVGGDRNTKNPGLIATNDSGLGIDVEQLQGKSESTPALAQPSAPARSATSQTHNNNNNNNSKKTFRYAAHDEPGGQSVIFKPENPIGVPNSDVNISIERRNKTNASMGLTMVTSVAHVWFNTFFEGNGPEQDGVPDDHGVFVLDWDKLDGIKGSSQKGSRAAEKVSVVWRHVRDDKEKGEDKKPKPEVAVQPPAGVAAGIIDSPSTPDVPQMRPADWQGNNREDPDANKHLGLRREAPDSAGVSRASSVVGIPVGDSAMAHAGSGSPSNHDHGADANKDREKDHEEALASFKASGPEGEANLDESSTSEGETKKP